MGVISLSALLLVAHRVSRYQGVGGLPRPFPVIWYGVSLLRFDRGTRVLAVSSNIPSGARCVRCTLHLSLRPATR